MFIRSSRLWPGHSNVCTHQPKVARPPCPLGLTKAAFISRSSRRPRGRGRPWPSQMGRAEWCGAMWDEPAWPGSCQHWWRGRAAIYHPVTGGGSHDTRIQRGAEDDMDASGERKGKWKTWKGGSSSIYGQGCTLWTLNTVTFYLQSTQFPCFKWSNKPHYRNAAYLMQRQHLANRMKAIW